MVKTKKHIKIGILTINDYTNYGNRLQNYASQETLRNLDLIVDTLVFTRRNKYLLNVRIFIKKNIDIIKARGKNIKEYKKIKAFTKYTNKFISQKYYNYSNKKELFNINQEYDYFITGSDQVWNPNYRNGSPIDFLTFAPNYKRVAFSPSFGVTEIPLEFVEDYRKWLSEMAHLSVREQAGANIIKTLAGRNAIVLVDPTLMLSKEKWLSVSKRADQKPQRSYLLTYFLGDVDAELTQTIKTISSKYDLEIVQLASMNDKTRYATDPGEFLDYINSADIVFTDSFHGSVFSILFEKPFIVFDRVGKGPSMNSRIDTLLSKFEMEDRKWRNVKDNKDIFNVNFSHVPEILEIERKKVLDYLKNALNIKDAN